MIKDILELNLIADASVVRLDSEQRFKIAEVRHSMEGLRPEAIAKLLAAAPDMLRLLMEIKPQDGMCQFCLSKTKKKGSFHADGCAWVAIMKRVGVAP
jgi:hypothetical protein